MVACLSVSSTISPVRPRLQVTYLWSLSWHFLGLCLGLDGLLLVLAISWSWLFLGLGLSLCIGLCVGVDIDFGLEAVVYVCVDIVVGFVLL